MSYRIAKFQRSIEEQVLWIGRNFAHCQLLLDIETLNYIWLSLKQVLLNYCKRIIFSKYDIWRKIIFKKLAYSGYKIACLNGPILIYIGMALSDLAGAAFCEKCQKEYMDKCNTFTVFLPLME